jgi:hypothetical protein
MKIELYGIRRSSLILSLTRRIPKMVEMKRSKNKILISMLAPAVISLASSLTYAQDSSNGQPPNMQAIQAAFQQCGISAPTPGSQPPQLTDSQKQCLKNAGINLPSGPPPGGFGGGPNPAQFQKIKDCFQADNVQLPSPPQNGQPPSLTDAQKAEFQKCRSQVAANSISSQSGNCGSDGSACGNNYQTQAAGGNSTGDSGSTAAAAQ